MYVATYAYTVACILLTRCLGFKSLLGWDYFLCSGCLGNSEDSDSLLQKGLVPKRGLVPL